MFASIGYVETEFDEYVGGTDTPTDLSGNEFPQAPKLSGSVGGGFLFGDGFYSRLVVSHTDDSYYTVNNLATQLNEPFTLVNAQLGYEAESWAVYLYGRNVLDEQYLSRRRADGFSTAGDSRVIGISFSYQMRQL